MAILFPRWWLCCLSLLAVPADFYGYDIVFVPGHRSEVAPCLTRMSPPLQPNCGDGLCQCVDYQADCSGHWGKLTYIPRLPNNITNVDISCNNISSRFLTSNTLANLTRITKLNLSYNTISWLPRGVFKTIRNLYYLTLDGNEALELSSLTDSVLVVRTLRSLSAKSCNLSPPPVDLFRNNTSLDEVRLDSNPHAGTYNLGGLCALRTLKVLYLLECDFRDITSPCSLHSLKTLDMTGNALRGFPKTCIGEDSIFPNLRTLYLASNRIEVLSTAEVCLPSLTQLDMSNNFIVNIRSGTFNGANFPNLLTLALQHQSSTSNSLSRSVSIEDNAFGNPGLRFLLLYNNEMDFAGKDISTYAFANCSNIQFLQIDSNKFLHVDDQRFLQLFGHLRSLESLTMNNNMLESVSTKTFANFPRLKMLDLKDNIIDNIPDGAFDSLERLEALFLHNNKIKTINENTFGKDLRGRLAELTLSLNPFECSCDLVWFQRWLLSTDNRLDPHEGIGSGAKAINYKCRNVPGTTLANFSLSEQACLLSQDTSVFIIQSCSVVLFALTLFSLLFRFRWHLRLLMYEVFRGRDVLRRQRLMENDFDFDVFVSYASEDLPWVREQLMARLEGELGLKLCVHERDFIPGNHIVDNIVQCVEGSKKILMLFSRHFVRSQWCQFELSLCLTHVMDYDDALIVVCLDDVTSRQMTSSMMAVMKTTTYIQWRGEEEDAVTSFWGRLHLALHEVMPDNEQYV